MQFPSSTKIEHSCEREDAGDALLKGSQTQRQLSSSGVASHTHPLQVQSPSTVLQGAICGPHIFKSSRPSTTWISHSPVLHIPRGYTGFGQRCTEMSCIREIIFGAPVSAVNEKDHRMRTFAAWSANIYKLVGIWAVWDPAVGIRRFFIQDGFIHSGSIKETVVIRKLRL